MARPPSNNLRTKELQKFFQTTERMPSYSEIAGFCKFKSKYAALRLVQKWLNFEWVKKDEQGRLLPGKKLMPVKVLGTVQAGWPSPAEEEMVKAKVEAIAKDKMTDLNAFTVESAMKMVAGTARSMGITVSGNAPWNN